MVLFLPSGKVGVGDAYFSPDGFYFICYRTVTYKQDKDADARIAFNFGLVGALMAKSEEGEYQASVYRDALKLTCGARASLGFWSTSGPKKSPAYDAMGGIAGKLWGMPVAARQKLFPESLFIPRAEIVSIDVQVGDGSQKFAMGTQGGGYLAWNDLRGGAEKKFLLEPTQGYLRGESVVYPESDPDGLQVGLTTGINQLLLEMSQDRPPTSDADIARLTSAEKYFRRLWQEFDSQFSMRTREAVLLHSRRSCVGLYRCLCEQLTRELKENTSPKSSKWQLPGCLSIVLAARAWEPSEGSHLDGTLPAIDAALKAGKLSYAKVRALSRVATPETEAKLLEVALYATGAQLERLCRSYRTALTAENVLPPPERSVRRRELPGGMVKLEIVLSCDEADLVEGALERAREVARAEAKADPSPADADVGGLSPSGRGAERCSRANGDVGGAERVSRADAVVALAESRRGSLASANSSARR